MGEIAASPARHAVIVCGMHRSGTSALARVCDLMGARLGTGISGTGPDNPKGFWENTAVKELDDELLARMGLSWDSVLSPPELWWTDDWVKPFRHRARAALEAQFAGMALFAVKDPRASRLLPFWLEVLAELDVAPHVLIAVRHPSEVAQSLARRNNLPLSRSYLLWLWHTLDAVAAAPPQSSCLVRYQALLADPVATMAAAAGAAGFAWPASPEAARAEAAGFLDAALRHHAALSIAPSLWPVLDHSVATIHGAISAAPVTALDGLRLDTSSVETARLVALLGGAEAEARP